MLKQPKVSIIIPVYNSEKYLEMCVKSVCNQTYDNLEIILVDDGSTDDSYSICSFLSEKDDIDAMEKEIIRICETQPYTKEACIERAKMFDKDEKFKEYIELYEVLNGDK